MAILNRARCNSFRRFATSLNSTLLFVRIVFLALCVMVLPFHSPAQTASAEYKIKAVFLFNFVQFVEWPAKAFSGEQSPTIIGVLGNDPFGKTLNDTVEGEIIRGRKIEVRRYKTVKEIGECHVLFISPSETAKLESILANLKGRSILTVSDSEDFASKRGGMVRLYTEKNRIRLRVNLEAAKAEHLSISSKLLQLAEIVPAKSQ